MNKLQTLFIILAPVIISAITSFICSWFILKNFFNKDLTGTLGNALKSAESQGLETKINDLMNRINKGKENK